MFYVILIIAGIVLAANRKQQVSTTTPVTQPQSDTLTIPAILSRLFPGDLHHIPIVGPGIGTGLAANTGGMSNIVVSGPTFYRPDQGGPPASAHSAPSAPSSSGSGTSGGATPSGTGTGGAGYGVPRGPGLPSTL